MNRVNRSELIAERAKSDVEEGGASGHWWSPVCFGVPSSRQEGAEFPHRKMAPTFPRTKTESMCLRHF